MADRPKPAHDRVKLTADERRALVGLEQMLWASGDGDSDRAAAVAPGSFRRARGRWIAPALIAAGLALIASIPLGTLALAIAGATASSAGIVVFVSGRWRCRRVRRRQLPPRRSPLFEPRPTGWDHEH